MTPTPMPAIFRGNPSKLLATFDRIKFDTPENGWIPVKPHANLGRCLSLEAAPRRKYCANGAAAGASTVTPKWLFDPPGSVFIKGIAIFWLKTKRNLDESEETKKKTNKNPNAELKTS